MEDDYRWHSQVFKPGEAEAASKNSATLNYDQA